MSKPGEFQSNEKQYQMPNALKQKKDFVYRVGYTASTGNDTGGKMNLASVLIWKGRTRIRVWISTPLFLLAAFLVKEKEQSTRYYQVILYLP